MRFFSLKTCDTCRKALKELRAAGLDPEVIDVRADGVSSGDLDAMLGALGDAVINRKSTTWRGLNDAARAAAPKALLSEHPTLLKRPVIEAEGQWTVGWTADVKSKVLG